MFHEYLGGDPFKESEKGLVILGAAFIEELLNRLLTKRLIGGKKSIKKLKFKELINLSYSTGIISQKVKEDLNILREIRNKAAHYSKEKIDKNWILGELSKLNYTKKAFNVELIKKEDKFRIIYSFAISFYLGILGSDFEKINNNKCLKTFGEK